MSQQLSLREARTKRQKNTSYKHSRLKFRSTLKPSRSEHSPSDPEDDKNSQRKKIMKLDTDGEGSANVVMSGDGGEKSTALNMNEEDIDMADVTKGAKKAKGNGGPSATITAPVEAKDDEKKNEKGDEEKDEDKDEEKEEEKDDEKNKKEDKKDDNDEGEGKGKDGGNDEKKDGTDEEPEGENEERDKREDYEEDKDSEDTDDEKNTDNDEKEKDNTKDKDEGLPPQKDMNEYTDKAQIKISGEEYKKKELPTLSKKKTKMTQDKRVNKKIGGRKDFHDEFSGDDSDDPFSYLKMAESRRLTLELFKKFKNVRGWAGSDANESGQSTSSGTRNTKNEYKNKLYNNYGLRDTSSDDSDNDGDESDNSNEYFNNNGHSHKRNKFFRNDYGYSTDTSSDEESDIEETKIEKKMEEDNTENKTDDYGSKAFETTNNQSIEMQEAQASGEAKVQVDYANNLTDDVIGIRGTASPSGAESVQDNITVSDIEHAYDPYDIEQDIDDDPSDVEDICEFLSEDGASGGDDDISFLGDDDFMDEAEELRGTG